MESEIVRAGTSGSAEDENENDPSKMGWDGKHELDYVEKEWGWDGKRVLNEIQEILGREGRLRELDEIDEELNWDGRSVVGDTEKELDWIRRRILHHFKQDLENWRKEQPSSTPDRFILDDIVERLQPSIQAATHYTPKVLLLDFIDGRSDDFEYEKLECVETFLNRAYQGCGLDDVVKFVQQRFGKIKDFYSVEINYPPFPHDNAADYYRSIYEVKFERRMEHIEYLVKNIILVIELFLRAYPQKEKDEIDKIDLVVSHPLNKHDIIKHLVMIKNQLPFFILRDLYNHVVAANLNKPSFLLLNFRFFASFSSQKFSRIQHLLSTSNTQYADFRSKLENAKHFTDFVRTLQLPCSSDTNQIDEDVSLCCKFFSSIKSIPGKIFTSLCSSARLNRSKKDEDN